MALSKFGFIVTGPGLDPAQHRVTLRSQAFEMIAVGVSGPEQALDVARGMLAEDVQLIELCGGFGPIWTGRVIEALESRIPVGAVSYGPESIRALHGLFDMTQPPNG